MKIIVGNWKMNGNPELLGQILDNLSKIKTNNKIILCVPYTMLCIGNKNVDIGAQDVSKYESGAYTGQVSAKMAFESGAKYTIVGHSESREYCGITNSDVHDKVKQAIKNNLIPIICVGETESERNLKKTDVIIIKELHECIHDIVGNFIVAYEPRWAIGAGITPSIKDIKYIHNLIYNELKSMGYNKIPILYGAGVSGKNSKDIMSIPHVDGVLVGGASLKIENFMPIIESVN